MTNLAAGTYSWSASICDFAGDMVSNVGTFYAIGTTAGAGLSDVSVPDGMESAAFWLAP